MSHVLVSHCFGASYAEVREACGGRSQVLARILVECLLLGTQTRNAFTLSIAQIYVTKNIGNV